MDEFRERQHIAQADGHIAEAKDRIARQKGVIAELERDGHETDTAVSLLHALEHTLLALSSIAK